MDKDLVSRKEFDVVSVSNYGDYTLYPDGIKQVLPSEDGTAILIWFTDDELPNLMLEVPDGYDAQEFIDDMYHSIRRLKIKPVN